MKATEDKRTLQDLQQLQALPLKLKISLTKQRIRQWVNEFGVEGVYVSFSGGKDSTVLLHLVRELYPNVEAVFCDTGLEYPEIREFVKTFDNVTWLKPKMNFREVIEKYGYPFISKEVSQRVFDVKTSARNQGINYQETNLYKRHFVATSEYCIKFPQFCCEKWSFFFNAPFNISHKCCDTMKKLPSKEYEKKTGKAPILGTMASESRMRTTNWIRHGCNAFDSSRPKSAPMSFWTEQDVLLYIYENHIPICSVYGDVIKVNEVEGQTDWADYGIFDLERPMLKTTGCDRTGCMFCGYGCHIDDGNNFTRMKETHPKQYAYIMKPWDEGGLGYKEVIDWIGEHSNVRIRY